MMEEKLRWFWMGRRPQVKKAVEFYINSILIGKWESQYFVAAKFHIHQATISSIISKICEDDLLYEHYFGDTNRDGSKQRIPNKKTHSPNWEWGIIW